MGCWIAGRAVGCIAVGCIALWAASLHATDGAKLAAAVQDLVDLETARKQSVQKMAQRLRLRVSGSLRATLSRLAAMAGTAPHSDHSR